MIKVISCGVFKPYIEHLEIDKSIYQFVYLDIHQHNQPKQLSKELQREINKPTNASNIILLYGLCGGALLSITTNSIPITIVQVHDCMAILLGSKKKYFELTKTNKSIQWTSYSLRQSNYINNSIDEWSNQYDEETVEYLKEMLLFENPIYIYLDIDKESNVLQEYSKVIVGSNQFLKDILLLQAKDIITLYPRHKLKQSLDNKVVISLPIE